MLLDQIQERHRNLQEKRQRQIDKGQPPELMNVGLWTCRSVLSRGGHVKEVQAHIDVSKTGDLFIHFDGSMLVIPRDSAFRLGQDIDQVNP